MIKNSTKTRSGCKDIWNAFMAEGAIFGKYDIPFCPTTSDVIPKSQVTWEEAKQLHKTLHLIQTEALLFPTMLKKSFLN